MPVLKLKVRCFRCNQEVDKLEARQVESVSPQSRYECFPCFKKHHNAAKKVADAPQREFYCERCRYKFSSKTIMCPYCNKDDQLHKGKVTAYDLV